MKTSLLLPKSFKIIGYILFVVFLIFVLFVPDTSVWNLKVLAIFDGNWDDLKMFQLSENDVYEEIYLSLLTVSLLFIAFSKEEHEDEYINSIRLNTLLLSTYIGYGFILFSFLFVYDFVFLSFILFSLFAILVTFIIVFNIRLCKLKYSKNEK